MKMIVSTMGPNTDFKQWKRNFLTFLSLKVAYFIPHLAIRESNVWFDEAAQTYAYVLLLHAASENKRADQAVKCISVARLDCATTTWDILCERLDGRSFARSLSMFDNLMLQQRPSLSLIEYVNFMRLTFDDYNETFEMINGSAAIHPYTVGLLMLRGISSTGHFGHAKQCVVNAFDTNYLMSADEVMAILLHMAQNMDEDLNDSNLTSRDSPAPPIYSFVAACRSSQSGRGHNNRGGRGCRGLPNKCSACGSLNHLMSSCIASDEALLKWTLAKRKMFVKKFGTLDGNAFANAALLSDVPTNDTGVMSTLEECTDEYDATEVSVPVSSFAFSSSLDPGRYLSQFCVIDSACSINLSAFRSDLVTFDPPSVPSRVGGVGVDNKGSGTVRIPIPLVFGQSIHNTVHAMYTRDMSSRSAERIGRLLSVSWMQTHNGCQFGFLTDCDNRLLTMHNEWVC
jgi:hypothetical protein